MLILTRRVGETLMIGDEVTVTVLGVKGNQYVLVLTLLKKYLSTVKRSTSVSRAEKSQQSVTDIVASRCRARRNPPAIFPAQSYRLISIALFLTTPLPLSRPNTVLSASVFCEDACKIRL